jgi:hypothetical protein
MFLSLFYSSRPNYPTFGAHHLVHAGSLQILIYLVHGMPFSRVKNSFYSQPNDSTSSEGKSVHIYIEPTYGIAQVSHTWRKEHYILRPP